MNLEMPNCARLMSEAFLNSGHSSQGSRGGTTPPLSHRQKLINTFLPLFSSPTQENIFVFMLLSVKLQSVLYCFQCYWFIVTLHNSIRKKNHRLIPKSFCSYHHFLQLNRCHGYSHPLNDNSRMTPVECAANQSRQHKQTLTSRSAGK